MTVTARLRRREREREREREFVFQKKRSSSRPSTEITAFDGGMCNIGVIVVVVVVLVVVGAMLTRVLFVACRCASARCIAVGGRLCGLPTVQLEVTQVYKRAKHDVGINSCLVKSCR